MSNNHSPLVLMYHGVLSGVSPVIPPNRGTGAELYYVSVDNFKTQMKWLKDNGYTATLAGDLKSSIQEKAVVITFDDGEMNNYLDAMPVLIEFGWKAYFFIIIKRIGENGYMGWKELKELQKAGMIVGSHGLTHEILTNLLDTQMEEELRGSKKNLEINLGCNIDSLSIPRGFCNDKVIETAYSLGYQTVFISERPAGLKANCISRIAVKSNWSLGRFELALNGRTPISEMIGNALIKVLKFFFREAGYNWIRTVLIKLFR